MANYPTNQERTADYLKNFDREKTLKYLINQECPIIFDVGANIGSSLEEFKEWWPNSKVHCFEPQHECWKDLEEKVKNFGFTDVFINKYAVGDTTVDYATFYSHDITSGQSGFNKINPESLDSINLLIKSTTRVFLMSGQFSLNVRPIIRTLVLVKVMVFLCINCLICSTIYTPILSFSFLPARITSGLYPRLFAL